MARGRAVALIVAAVVGGLAWPAGAQTPTTCKTVDAPAGVFVNLADDLNREAIGHARDAVARGQPRVLHWRPELADANREASLRGFPIWSRLTLERRKAIDPEHFDLTHDRDEYPPAASAEGGAGADVAYILSADNRSAGSRMRAQMDDFCGGTAFVLEP